MGTLQVPLISLKLSSEMYPFEYVLMFLFQMQSQV